ncbi:MAG: FAD-dependent monooxygenase [Phycisphaerae bacterium]|nr:FAD-dependent monooxygenase [Phycisphaerae bacterium]
MAKRVLIVGAGLGGSLLALYLGRAGHKVMLVERRGDPRAKNYVGGRSINLAISARGIHALERAGLASQLLEHGIRMPGRMIHPVQGAPVFQPYSRDPSRAINSVSRSRLNLLLLNAATDDPNVEARFDLPCVDADFAKPAGIFRRADGSTEHIEADLVVATDGAYSAVRSAMQKNERVDYSQSYLSHGYKELTIPAADGGGFRIERNALHIWPRGGSMMIALPNPDGTFTCTLFWPFDGPDSFATIRTDDDVRRHFERVYPDALPHMPTLLEDFRGNPVGSMVTVRTSPWHLNGTVALLGDAAHAVVPFYGQGANASFEDCEALVDALTEFPNDQRAALDAYQTRRIRNANAIADMALANFIEMRDKTASSAFRLKKKAEHALHGLLGNAYLPLYDMVSFTTIPYAEARERAQRQQRAVVTGAVVAAGALVAGAAAAAWALA